MADRTPAWAWRLTFPPALLGLGLSVYLTVVHYTEPASLSCPNTGVINCTRVTTSAESMLWGHIPVALAGAVYFLAMAALLTPAGWRRTGRQWMLVRPASASAGMAMVLWLVYAEVVTLRSICLWCTAVHVVMFALFVAIVAASTWKGVVDDDDTDTEGTERAAVAPAADHASAR